MELLVATLALALLLVLGWALALRRRLRAARPIAAPPSSPSESLHQLFDAVTAAIDAGLIILDGERGVRYMNPQAADLLDVRRPQPGQRLITVLRDYQVDSLVGDVLRDGEPREATLQPGALRRTLRLRASPISSGGERGVILLVRDVTQLSMLERARRDLVANVSHELRTPLASVKLLVETLQSEPPPSVAQRMLGQMAHEVDAIAQLVDELHELSQIESGRVALQLAPATLAPLASRAIERIRPQAERKGLRLSVAIPDDLPPALMDADRVGQVLLILLHNAAKFTPEQGAIEVSALPLAVGADGEVPGMQQQHPPGDWVLLRVSDTGIGIPSHELPRIFERFYKVDRARTRDAGGTGLGLAIARHLVEGHGGRIWASSQEGAGSTFFFTLPAA